MDVADRLLANPEVFGSHPVIGHILCRTRSLLTVEKLEIKEIAKTTEPRANTDNGPLKSYFKA